MHEIKIDGRLKQVHEPADDQIYVVGHSELFGDICKARTINPLISRPDKTFLLKLSQGQG